MTWERHHARVSAIVPPVLTAPLSSRRSLNETAASRLPASSREGSQGGLWGHAWRRLIQRRTAHQPPPA